MEPLIRPMSAADIEFALEQTAREGWQIAAGGFQMHLEHDADGCFIAEVEGRPIGMITSTRYGGSAFVGNLIVVPDCRRMGIGRILMYHTMQGLGDGGVSAVRLEADPPGVPLYRELGFTDVFDSLRFHCEEPAPVSSNHSIQVRPLVGDDLAEAGDLDRRGFGDDRTGLLASLAGRSPAPFVATGDGVLIGYIVPQLLPDAVRLGPWVAENAEVAEALLDAVLREVRARRYEVGLPGVNTAGVALLERRGFLAGGSCLRMIRGNRRYDGNPESIFGIAGGDRG